MSSSPSTTLATASSTSGEATATQAQLATATESVATAVQATETANQAAVTAEGSEVAPAVDSEGKSLVSASVAVVAEVVEAVVGAEIPGGDVLSVVVPEVPSEDKAVSGDFVVSPGGGVTAVSGEVGEVLVGDVVTRRSDAVEEVLVGDALAEKIAGIPAGDVVAETPMEVLGEDAMNVQDVMAQKVPDVVVPAGDKSSDVSDNPKEGSEGNGISAEVEAGALEARSARSKLASQEVSQEEHVQRKEDTDRFIEETLKEYELEDSKTKATPSRLRGKQAATASSEDSDEVWEVSPEPAKKSGSSKKKPATSSKLRTLPTRRSDRRVLRKRTRDDEVKVTEQGSQSYKRTRAAKREFLEELVCTEEWFRDQKLESVFELLKAQGWQNLFVLDEVVSPSRVAEFYENLTLEEKGKFVYLDFKIGDSELRISSTDLSTILGIPHSGYDHFTKGVWPPQAENRYVVQKRVCGTEDPGQVSTKFMDVSVKILHKFLVTNFLPRSSKTSFVQMEDLLVLDKLLKKEYINLPKLILNQIEYLSTLKVLGYPRIIKQILLWHEVYGSPEDEVPITKNFDALLFKKLGLVFDADLGWVRDSAKQSEDLMDEEPAEAQEPAEVLGSIEQRLQVLEESQKELKDMVTEVLAIVRSRP